jgi:hypothetical protein
MPFEPLTDPFIAKAVALVPILRSRGLFRQDYAGRTLRDHLGLPRPANPYAAAAE